MLIVLVLVLRANQKKQRKEKKEKKEKKKKKRSHTLGEIIIHSSHYLFSDSFDSVLSLGQAPFRCDLELNSISAALSGN